MEKLITEILEIEENAKKRIADAEQECARIIDDAREKKEKLVSSKIQEAENKIRNINSDEKMKAEKNLNEIEKNKIAEISNLDEIFNSQHTKWEDDIFNQIVNG